MECYQYEFIITAVEKQKYIIADSKGNSFYLPSQMAKQLGKMQIGNILHMQTTEKLQTTELSGTNSMILKGEWHIRRKGSLLETYQTKAFFVSGVTYGSILLTDLQTGKDYMLFNNSAAHGYWKNVAEGNTVRFLLWNGMPVMPAPNPFVSRLLIAKEKAPVWRASI